VSTACAGPSRKALAHEQEIKGVPAIEVMPAVVVPADSGPFPSARVGSRPALCNLAIEAYAKTAARFRIILSMERDLKCLQSLHADLWNVALAIQQIRLRSRPQTMREYSRMLGVGEAEMSRVTRPLPAWMRSSWGRCSRSKPRGIAAPPERRTIAGSAWSYIRSLPLPRRKEIG
jgi:hypothetical protein